MRIMFYLYLEGKNVFQCFWSDPKTRVFECFWVSLCILDMVKLFFSVFGQTQKHVFLSVFLSGSVLFLPSRFVGGVTYCMWYFLCFSSLSVPYGGSGSALDRFYLFSWFAGFTRFSLMSSSSILGCQSRVSLICASGSIFLFVL